MRRQRKLIHKDDFLLGATFGGFSLIVLISLVAMPIVLMNLIGYRDKTVTEGKIQVVQDIRKQQNSRYRLFVSHPVTSNPIEEYEIRDSFWRGVWNSGTTLNQSMANEGNICQVYGIGRRIRPMSWYPIPTEIVCRPQSNLPSPL